MEERAKALRTMKEFIAWYESREEMPTNKLHEFYVKFKYIVEQEEEMVEYLRKFLG
jgi:hypothetical protein